MDLRHDDADLASFGGEVLKAVEQLKLVAWDAIHKEKFWITPTGLFQELVRSAENLVNRQAGEAERRRLRLKAAHCEDACGQGSAHQDGEEEQQEASEVLPDQKDKFGLNLDEFKNKSRFKPPGWRNAVQSAAELHLDEMRTLLELHYDDVHLAKWKHRSKAPGRASEFKVFRAVAQVHRKQLNQRLTIPASVKDVLQQPQDETDWTKAEKLRVALLRVLQGEVDMVLTEEEAEALAAAVRDNHSAKSPAEVGKGFSKLPSGCRVCVGVPEETNEKHVAK